MIAPRRLVAAVVAMVRLQADASARAHVTNVVGEAVPRRLTKPDRRLAAGRLPITGSWASRSASGTSPARR